MISANNYSTQIAETAINNIYVYKLYKHVYML